MSRSAVRVFVGIMLAVIVIIGVGGVLAWLKISGLKKQLVQDLGNAIGAQVEISSIDLDPWKGELRAAGISLVNQRPSAPWDKADASQAIVHFHLSDLLSSTLPVTVEVSSWNVELHPSFSTPATPGSAAPGNDSDALPTRNRVQVTSVSAQDGSAQFDLANGKKIVAHGVAFDAADNGAGVWNTQLHATSIASGTLQIGTSSVQIRGDSVKATFSGLRMVCDQGAITGDGEVALGGVHDAKFTLKAVDVPITMLVALQWQVKLSGLASGDVVYQGNDQGSDAKGSLSVAHGKFNVLPWLGKVTTMVGLQDISGVELDKATSDFEWKDGALHLTNIDVRKNDVTRIAGEVDVAATGQVDGHVKLGLPSTVTGKWPQIQTQVFPVQLEDFNWAEVHLTGTADNLQEDLTGRLVTAGLGQGGDLINSATQKASDLINNFLGK